MMKNKGKTASELNYPYAELWPDQRLRNSEFSVFILGLAKERHFTIFSHFLGTIFPILPELNLKWCR